MAIGQAVLSSAVLDTAEVELLQADLETGEADRHVAHAAQLWRALRLDRLYRDAGLGLQTTAELGLLWRCSEEAASARLWEAQLLDRLGALAVLRTGLLTIEQGRVVVDILGTVDDELALSVWSRLEARLEQDARFGAVLPPARAAELLRRWLLEADAAGVAERRKQAEDACADVDLWKRDDGLVDIAIRAVTGPNAQAVGQRIREHAEPIGPGDQRPAGMRYRDAAIDLLLGRTTLPFTAESAEAAAELGIDLTRCGRPGCGCGQGSSVPCGVDVQVLVPISSALGTSDVPAELVGHGPIDADLLQQLLLSAPVLTRVWVDAETGVPVAVDDRAWSPTRDPEALRAALLEMAGDDPPRDLVPVHPDDHPPRSDPPTTDRGRNGPAPPAEVVLDDAALGRPELLNCAHPTNTPGPYVVPRRLRRLLLVRSPRCEWPGCGRRATKVAGTRGCDIDHDLAWPEGPTCGCNTGPLCRRHHRIKQLGWIKQRRIGGHVRWTSPLGRSWLSRAQHQPPPAPVRPLAPLPPADPLAGLTDAQLAEVLWHNDPSHSIFDSDGRRPTPDDIEPLDTDTTGERYRWGDLWTRLDDPTAWHPYPDLNTEG